ncbi:hypothetical protein [Polynucleobacter sp. CS-Odin-A6]|uniref:hypothetical protein n=1 Tax=Polynucleobacter sp. CS-Odin-A6 TaxID=2689106 RepID=UPI001C0E731A|nr:hypothetical protein [Polynucleobacter sp. CS-Odin-A6]MBU3622006.1 hypothetical protein [Polynucleobacter sp. CS-Odin-A6]
MKFFAIVLMVLLASHARAEDLLVPISDFDNDSQKLTNSRVLEFWGYHGYQGKEDYKNTLTIRYYNPLEWGDWRGRIRIDSSVISNYGANMASNNSGQYSAGNTMVTIWGQERSLLKPLGALVGTRVIFPFGNNGQWAVGPQLSWSFNPTVDTVLRVTDFSPLIRYMYGFDSKSNSMTINPSQPPLLRNLQIYPTVGFKLSTNTMLRFLDENGIVYHSAGGGWFVPIDAMVTHRLTKNLVLAVGGSKQVVQTYQQYDWMAYAKVSLNF